VARGLFVGGAGVERGRTETRRHKKDKSQKQAGRQPFFVFNFL